jgi:hypothetical protein
VPYADFADPQSLNLYTYVRNVPTVSVDADGHQNVTCYLSCKAHNISNFFKDQNKKAIQALATITVTVFAKVYTTFHSEDNQNQTSHSQDNSKTAPTPQSNPAPGTQTPADKANAAAQPTAAQSGQGAQTNTGSKPTSLPVEGEPGTTATKLHPDGSPKQVRQYGADGKAKTDVDFHPSPAGNPHAHDWDHSGDQPQRGDPRPIKPTDPKPNN